MKRVLVITSSFPPLGGIAQARVASFVRHLPSFGWDPGVVTIGWTDDNSDWMDQSLFDDELERRVVFRSPEPDLRRNRSRIPSLLRPEGFRLDWRAACRQIGDRLRHGERVEGSWHFIRGADRFLRRHLSDRRYDLILATSPDLAPFRIGSKVSRRSGIPWVADCRDDYIMLKPGKPVYGQIELSMLRSASAIVTVSSGVAETLRERTGREVEIIENGFEADHGWRAPEAPVVFDRQAMNIVYTGSLANYYPERSPEVLFEGIAALRKESPEVRIRVHFFGDSKFEAVLEDLRARFGWIDSVLVNHGRVSFAESRAAQLGADILMICAHPGLKGILTGKVFEYLAAGRPIVSVPGDDGELDGLLRRTKAGRALRSAEESIGWLRGAYEAWERGGGVPYSGDQSVIMEYSRQKLTGKLAARLNEVLDCSRSARLDPR